jgi:hypothetical protein
MMPDNMLERLPPLYGTLFTPWRRDEVDLVPA